MMLKDVRSLEHEDHNHRRIRGRPCRCRRGPRGHGRGGVPDVGRSPSQLVPGPGARLRLFKQLDDAEVHYVIHNLDQLPSGWTMRPAGERAPAASIPPPVRPDPATPAILASIAATLLANGQTSEGTRAAVEQTAHVLGHPVRFTARWGEFTLQPDGAATGGSYAAEPTNVDVCRVTATEQLVDDVCGRRLQARAALARLDAVGRLPPVSLVRFAPMAAAGASALGVISGAADLLTLSLIAVSAGVGACLRRFLMERLTARTLVGTGIPVTGADSRARWLR